MEYTKDRRDCTFKQVRVFFWELCGAVSMKKMPAVLLSQTFKPQLQTIMPRHLRGSEITSSPDAEV